MRTIKSLFLQIPTSFISVVSPTPRTKPLVKTTVPLSEISGTPKPDARIAPAVPLATSPARAINSPFFHIPVRSPVINDSGTLAFSAELNLGVGDSTVANNGGIWSGGQLVVRQGDIAAGTSNKYDLLLGVAINETGTLAYYGRLDDSINGGGIWTTAGLVARAGEVAPGTEGARFSAFEVVPSINDSGTVMFQGNLAIGVGDTTPFNEIGIWTNNGLVVRAGTELEIAPGETRTLLAVFARNQALANDGSIVFLAEFTDRTYGVFVATPVPEPSAFALCGLIFATMLLLRRCCRPR